MKRKPPLRDQEEEEEEEWPDASGERKRPLISRDKGARDQGSPGKREYYWERIDRFLDDVKETLDTVEDLLEEADNDEFMQKQLLSVISHTSHTLRDKLEKWEKKVQMRRGEKPGQRNIRVPFGGGREREVEYVFLDRNGNRINPEWSPP